MSVRHCRFPWHWMLVTIDGEVMPCGHGSKPIADLRQHSAEEIWNGPAYRSLRAAILAGEVHEVCRTNDCPYQRVNIAFTPLEESVTVDAAMAEVFDDAWYLETHADVRAFVERRQFASGFEHFARHGQAEGRAYRLVSRVENVAAPPIPNAALALVEQARGATVLRSKPVDLVFQVSTVCNLRCVMCPHGVGDVERPRHMPIAILERMAAFIDAADRMIVSGLGEPLIAPAFWKLIERCAGREKAFLRANSNALLMTPELARRVLDSGLKEISFSLDAATPETYAKIRGADFARTCRGVQIMGEERRRHPRRSLEVFVNMTLMVENAAEAPRFVELAHELGADAVLFSQLFPFGAQPRWRVKRGDWTFVYAKQMLVHAFDSVGEPLRAAQARADQLGVKVVWQSNTDIFLAEELVESGQDARCG